MPTVMRLSAHTTYRLNLALKQPLTRFPCHWRFPHSMIGIQIILSQKRSFNAISPLRSAWRLQTQLRHWILRFTISLTAIMRPFRPLIHVRFQVRLALMWILNYSQALSASALSQVDKVATRECLYSEDNSFSWFDLYNYGFPCSVHEQGKAFFHRCDFFSLMHCLSSDNTSL